MIARKHNKMYIFFKPLLSEIQQERLTFKTTIPSFCIVSILMAEYTLFRTRKSHLSKWEPIQ